MAGLVAARLKCLAIALLNAGDAVPGPVIRSPLSECSRGMIGSMTIYALGKILTSSTDLSDFETDLKPSS